MAEVMLDLRNIQGLAVRGYRLPVARYLFLNLQDPARSRAWLRRVTPEVLSAAPWDDKPFSGVNLAFTFSGLRALGLAPESLAGFPEEFRDGMASRAALLGDVGDSAPEHWTGGLGSGDVHALLMISARDGEALDRHDAAVRAELQRSQAITVVCEEFGAALPNGREHFGYADGFAQPAIEGTGLPAAPGQGAPLGRGRWRPLRAGEFLLGYPDEEGALPDAPAPDALAANGSYLVYRKLSQDVALFRRQVADAAARFGARQELLAAKLVGRWPDGTPLQLSPERPDPGLVADPSRNNAFDYAAADGQRCPLGAHIRRSNPRSGVPFNGKLVNRHRLIRRGIPYGPPLARGSEDDGRQRGILFVCLQASIARQFEFVQSQWLNDGNLFGLGQDRDVLLGAHDGTGKMTVQGQPPFFMGALSRVVGVRGGEYFFLPGINGLHYLGTE